MCPSGSSRWCPTPDQVMILEEMYKAGVRTPSASQIQKITAHLNLYGKIEGKNVFYWFQNHKARDRQKFRKKLSKQILLQQQHQIFQHHQFVPVSTSFLHGGYLDFMSPSVSSIPPLANYYSNAPNYLPPANTYNIIIPPDHQGGGDLMMVQKWKSSDTMNKELNPITMKMYSGGGWMMIEEEEEEIDSPACRATNKPVETLQLFPN